MVTFLETGLLGYFTPIFTFLFIWTAIYAVLQYTNFLRAGKPIHATIALVLALLSLLSDRMMLLVSAMAPFFVVAMIFLLLLLMIYRMFGMEENWIRDLIQGEESTLRYFILTMAIVVVMGLIAYVYGDFFASLTMPGNESVIKNIGATFFNPKVLGLVFTLAIAAFMILALAAEYKKKAE